jgi:hypothetical protein
MWSRSLLVQNLLVSKKAKPHDNDADSADAVAERPVASQMQIAPPLSGNFERALVNAVLSGETGAASRFLEHVSTTLWSIVVRLAGEGADAEAAFLHIVASLKADDYARLRGFDGRSRLTTYLSLAAREFSPTSWRDNSVTRRTRRGSDSRVTSRSKFGAGLADNCQADSVELVAKTRIKKCASS